MYFPTYLPTYGYVPTYLIIKKTMYIYIYKFTQYAM
jgi:hypothetical protein